MKIQKSAWKEKPVNLEDLRKAFEDIVDCPIDLNEPNFLEEDWVNTFENLYDIKLSKKELPLVQKYLKQDKQHLIECLQMINMQIQDLEVKRNKN